MVSRLILNLKNAAQTTSVWASGGRVSGVSHSDDEAPYRHPHQTYIVGDRPGDDISKEDEYVDSNEGSQEGGEGEEGEFRVGVTMSTEGPSGAGAVELKDLWVTRQEIGRISSSGSSRRWSRVIKV